MNKIEKNTSVLTLKPLGIRSEDGWTGVEWFLDGHDDQGFVLRHAVPDEDRRLLGDPSRADHALVTVLLLAMNKKKNIVVEGKVSPKLLDGLETMQDIWQRWRLYRYSRVDIRVDEESEAEISAQEKKAVFAFSGGVDSSFSLFRHLYGLAGRNNREPGAALLVHGMDISLELPDVYERAALRAKEMLQETGIPILRMRTNSRKLGMDWEDSHGMQLSSCFLLLQHYYAHAILGSGEPYDTLILPWGSTPFTDHLSSTMSMHIQTDGGGYDRTEKVKWLAQNTTVSNLLRVCWEGGKLDQNCGVCEKCVRTMLNFWATGQQVPDAFPKKLSAQKVLSIRVKNDVQFVELKNILKFAKEIGLDNDPIYIAIYFVLYMYYIATVKKIILKNATKLLRYFN